MPYLELQWKDGAPFNADFEDVYHSEEGCIEESRYVFLEGNDLPDRFASLQQGDAFTLAETGFGTGLNFIITVQSFLEHAPAGATLDYISVERDLVHPDDVRTLVSAVEELSPLYQELLQHYPYAVDGVQRLHLFNDRVRLTLLVGDVVEMLESLPQQLSADAWYLDGFAPSVNPRMWDQQVLTQVARLSQPGATASTYTIAGAVRRGLQQVGFDVGRRDGYGKKRDMMVAKLVEPATEETQLPWFVYPRATSKPSTVAVIGTGIAGLMTSLQLIRRGHHVTLIDRHDSVGSGASGNPAGLVMPRFSVKDAVDNRFQVQALIYAIQCYRELQADSDKNFWFDEPVQCALQQERVEALFEDVLFQQIAESIPNQEIDKGKRWLRYQYSGWLRPRLLCDAIFTTCAEAVHYLQANVARIEASTGACSLYDAEGHCLIEVDQVVLANAAGVTAIEGVPEMPLTWNLGQLTTVEVSGDVAATPLAAGAYSTPPIDGRITTGATYRHDLEQTSVLKKDEAFNLDNLQALQPGIVIDRESAEGRVSQRANLPDRIPLAGAVPDVAYYQHEYADLHHGRPASGYRAAQYMPGVYINVGHGSRGFTTAPLCAEIIASLIDGAPCPVSQDVLQHLHPARFIVRDLKKRA